MNAFSPLDFTEANRTLQIDTPLGKDAFLTEKFWCRQAVNDMDEAKVSVRAKRDDVKAEDIIGKEVTVSLSRGEGLGWREWNYLVTDLSEQPRLTRGLRQYELTLRPTMWLMSQRSDCRIFLNKTAVQIAEILCDEHGIRGLDTSRVFDLPPAQEYIVQWMETDLDFLLRMLQKYGIFYWIRQDDGKQVLVLTNKPIGWDKGADGDCGRARIAAGSTDCNHISEWHTDYRFVPGKHAGRDWNFEDPSRVQSSDVPSTVKLPRNGSYEFYKYPAQAMSRREAEKQMTSHAQASEASHQTIVGKSDLRGLEPGAKVTPFDLANPRYAYETAAITSIEHEAINQSFETTEGDTAPDYSNSFTALPAKLPATPERTIPRPRIDGTLPAIIAGPEGEEIHCSKYGDVKVWWQWDRRAKKDGTDTKWIRVTQPWAGAGWGSQVIPRIGMEAVVSFEDGDPDRPVIVGLLPNPNMKVPEELPKNKTRLNIKSQTYKGKGYNQIRMEDMTDKQEFFMHSEKDFNAGTKNNHVSFIKNNRHQQISSDDTKSVLGYSTEYIEQDYHLTTGGHVMLAVGINEGVKTFPDVDTTKEESYDLDFNKLRQTLQIPDDVPAGTYFLSTRGNISLNSGHNFNIHSHGSGSLSFGGGLGHHVGEDYRLGAIGKILAHAKKGLMLTSDTDAALSTGKAIIALLPGGKIELFAADIKLTASGKIEIAGSEIKLKKPDAQ